MPFCRNCGADVTDAKFCGDCGTATGQETAGASGGPATSSPQGKDPRGDVPIGDLGITENAAAALCYFLLPAAIFLVIEPYRDSRFIRFHCFQAIFCTAAILIALAIVTTILSLILGFLAYVLAWLIVLASFVYGIKLIMRIYAGENVKIPMIGDFCHGLLSCIRTEFVRSRLSCGAPGRLPYPELPKCCCFTPTGGSFPLPMLRSSLLSGAKYA